MTLVHILETVFLVTVAYLGGCVLGYAVRRVLHAARGMRRIPDNVPAPAMPAPPRPRHTMSPAARLASAGTDDPVSAAARPPLAPTRSIRQPAAPGPQPVTMDQPRAGGADDLKRIKGIGPKLEAALNGLGIYHFDQIAAWSGANVDWVDKQLAGKGRIRREAWVEQARALAHPERIRA